MNWMDDGLGSYFLVVAPNTQCIVLLSTPRCYCLSFLLFQLVKVLFFAYKFEALKEIKKHIIFFLIAVALHFITAQWGIWKRISF